MSKNNFNKNGYAVIRNAISKDLAKFCFDYINLKRKVVEKLFNDRELSPFTQMWGVWSDKQVPNTYSHYSDLVMETLLLKCKPILEKETGIKLTENYSYTRIYKKHDTLFKHKDRPECELSCTMNLGGDPWSLFLKKDRGKKQKVDLKPGDLLIYQGCELEHWRDMFKGSNHTQVFLHYSPSNKKGINITKYDGRPFIGLPNNYKT
jgi:putative sterol carrier protein